MWRRSVADIVSKRAASSHKAKVAHTVNVSQHKVAVKTSTDPSRLMLLMYVKVFIVTHLLPFNLSESADVRKFFEVCCDDAFPRTKIYPKMMKHCVAELYTATVSKLSHSLQDAVAGAGSAALHANFDLWTSKTSSEKYIGESPLLHGRMDAPLLLLKTQHFVFLRFCLDGDDLFFFLRYNVDC